MKDNYKTTGNNLAHMSFGAPTIVCSRLFRAVFKPSLMRTQWEIYKPGGRDLSMGNR